MTGVDPFRRRLERTAIVVCLAMTGLALVVARGRPGPAVGVLAGGLLIGVSYWTISLARLRRKSALDAGSRGAPVRFTRSSGVRYDCSFAPAPIRATGRRVLGCGSGLHRGVPPLLDEVPNLNARNAAPHRRRVQRRPGSSCQRGAGRVRLSPRSRASDPAVHGDDPDHRVGLDRALPVRPVAAERGESREAADPDGRWGSGPRRHDGAVDWPQGAALPAARRHVVRVHSLQQLSRAGSRLHGADHRASM